jgi:hypothetical protein
MRAMALRRRLEAKGNTSKENDGYVQTNVKGVHEKNYQGNPPSVLSNLRRLWHASSMLHTPRDDKAVHPLVLRVPPKPFVKAEALDAVRTALSKAGHQDVSN